MMGEPVCECGHVRDEHIDDCGECSILECLCVMYEEITDADR